MSTPTMFTPTEPGTSFSSRIGGLAKARETGILLALLLVIAITTIKNPAFLFSSDGFRDLLLTPSILVIVAIGEAIVIITLALWNPEDLGYLSAFAAKAVITGEIEGNEGDKFTAGKLGEKTVGADKTVLLGDPFKFNKDNIDQFDF